MASITTPLLVRTASYVDTEGPRVRLLYAYSAAYGGTYTEHLLYPYTSLHRYLALAFLQRGLNMHRCCLCYFMFQGSISASHSQTFPFMPF